MTSLNYSKKTTKNKPTLESQVVKQIRGALDKYYPGFYFKTHGGPFQMAGLPDILGLHKGRFIGIEVKLPGREKNLSEKQKQVIKKIRLAGGIAFMSTSAEHTINQLKEEFANDKPKGKGKATRTNNKRVN